MFVLLGSNGHVTGALARRLLGAGHRVRVVGRDAAKMKPLVAIGAETAIGDAGDAAFLAEVFRGAQSAYVMMPTAVDAPDLRAAQDRIGAAVAHALQSARVARVVNLSSIGAELTTGTGLIAGLHAQEARLDAIDGIDLLHLRPGYFMDNLLDLVPQIASSPTLVAMEAGDVPIPMVCTTDIAAVAARELERPSSRGVLHLHAAVQPTMQDAVAAIGMVLGRPDLRYVQCEAEVAIAAMRVQGVSADAAASLAALARWLSGGPVASLASGPAEVQPTTLGSFLERTLGRP